MLFQTAVLAFAVHQRKARCVPQLVAEVAVAFAALAVEIDAAAQAGQRGEGKAQGIRAERGNALGKFFLGVLAHLGCGFGLAQSFGAFDQQFRQGNAVDQVHRVEHIALGLAHLLALRILHQAVDVDMLERHLPGEMLGHHDHPGDPEENDVVAGDQYAAWEIQVVVIQVIGVGSASGRAGPNRAHTRCARQIARFVPGTPTGSIVAPAHGAEGNERAGVPGVEHIFVAAQRFARCPGLGLGFIAGHDHIAIFVVPRRNLVAPPQLAADAPVGDVVHPLVVGVDPVLRDERDLTACYCIDSALRNGYAGWRRLCHRHEPLVGEHGLDHLAGAGADRNHVFVRYRLFQKTLVLEVSEHRLAAVKAVQAPVGRRSVVVDFGV